MSINKSGSQVYFEGMFTGSSGFPFRQISKAQYEQTSLTKQQADDMAQLLGDEIASYYYKALLSYIESIPALTNKLFFCVRREGCITLKQKKVNFLKGVMTLQTIKELF